MDLLKLIEETHGEEVREPLERQMLKNRKTQRLLTQASILGFETFKTLASKKLSVTEAIDLWNRVLEEEEHEEEVGKLLNSENRIKVVKVALRQNPSLVQYLRNTQNLQEHETVATEQLLYMFRNNITVEPDLAAELLGRTKELNRRLLLSLELFQEPKYEPLLREQLLDMTWQTSKNKYTQDHSLYSVVLFLSNKTARDLAFKHKRKLAGHLTGRKMLHSIAWGLPLNSSEALMLYKAPYKGTYAAEILRALIGNIFADLSEVVAYADKKNKIQNSHRAGLKGRPLKALKYSYTDCSVKQKRDYINSFFGFRNAKHNPYVYGLFGPQLAQIRVAQLLSMDLDTQNLLCKDGENMRRNVQTHDGRFVNSASIHLVPAGLLHRVGPQWESWTEHNLTVANRNVEDATTKLGQVLHPNKPVIKERKIGVSGQNTETSWVRNVKKQSTLLVEKGRFNTEQDATEALVELSVTLLENNTTRIDVFMKAISKLA